MYNFVKENLIIDRLDAEFYSIDQINNQKKLEDYGVKPLSSYCTGVNVGYTGELGPLYSDQGTFLYRVSDIDNIFLNIEEAKLVPEKFAIENPNIWIRDGDIVFAAVGNTIGKVALKTNSIPNGVCSRALMISRPVKNRIDSHFLIAYLANKYAQKSLIRGVSGSAQPVLNTPLIANLPIIEVNLIAQKYIGNKVHQAEKLRAWAKKLRSNVDSQLNSLKLPINEPAEMINLMCAKDMEDRLDPRPYRSHYLKLTESIESIDHESISKITTLASGCPVSSKEFVENEGIPLVRIRNIGFDDFIGLDTGVGEDVYQDSAKYHAKEKMIVVGMDGIFRSQFFIADELPMLVNQRVAMLSPTNIRGELLTHWLNRPEGQMQLNQWAVKTTVEHTSLSDIGRILIPRLDKELEDRLADNLLDARLAYCYSKFLSQASKSLVEALIEGQLTEDQLIQAQQALGDGDNTLDKTTLNKLSNEGYAVEGGVPLFSNVDDLYRLLASATAADSED